MARFSIKSADGSVVRYSGKPRYNGIFGRPSYLEFAEIASPVKINFQVGDYVDYGRTGFRYYLYSVPQPIKSAANGSYGDAYIYKNVQFFCKTEDLEIAPFRDLVLNGATHFTTISDVSTFENVYGIADRIQANLNDFCGEGVWNVVCYDDDSAIATKMSEPKEFTLSDGSVLDALNLIYTQWLGLGWVYSVVSGVHTITIGRPNVQDSTNTTDVFYYGKGHGVKVLAKAISSKNEIATRLFAYGSTRNLPTRWYNKQGIYESGSVYIPNLMIPLSKWGKTGGVPDARKAFLEASAAIKSALGLRVKTIRFDGSGDYEEIYPSIEGMTFRELRAGNPEYRPSTSYADSARVDEVKSVVNPTDNGIIDTDGGKYKEVVTFERGDSETPVTLAAGQQSFSFGWSKRAVSVTKTGAATLDLSGVSYEISQLGLWAKSFSAVLTVRRNGNIIYSSSVPSGLVSRATGRFVITPGVHSFPMESAGSISYQITVKADVAPQSTAQDFVAECKVSKQPTISVSNGVPATFTMIIKQIGFDIAKQFTTDGNGYGTINMKTGSCAGRAFTILKVEYQQDTDDWKLTLQREEDSSIGQVFPNSQFTIKAADRYVITDIMMPDLYVNAAMQRLYDRASEVLDYMSKPKMIYTPEIDAKVLAESGERLIEGMYMRVYDTDIIDGQTVFVLIDSLTIDEGEDAIPTYAVTLRDEKAISLLEKISGESGKNSARLDSLEGAGDKKPFEGLKENDNAVVEQSVSIVSETTFFTYADGAPTADRITLTCEVVGINVETYVWQWYDDATQTWKDIAGATSQAYDVLEDGIYFPSDDKVARIRCVVNDSEVAETEIVKIVSGEKGDDAVNIALTAPSILFAGNVTTAKAQTFSVGVKAFVGTTPAATTIGSISGLIADKLVATILNDGTTNASISISSTTSLDTASGEISIPVTAGGVSETLKLSWAVAFKGSKGDKGDDGGQGFQGASVRGPIEWSASARRWCSGEKLTGGVDDDRKYIDIVFFNDHYYRCILSYTSTTSSANPASDTTHWRVADAEYAFIATKLLLAANAKIQFLAGNEVQLVNGASVVGGGQGGNGIIWWAGSSAPASAPWRVNYQGEFVAKKGEFGPLKVVDDGLDGYVYAEHYMRSSGKTTRTRVSGDGVLASIDDASQPAWSGDKATLGNFQAILGSDWPMLNVPGNARITGDLTLGGKNALTSSSAKRIEIVTDYPATLEDNVVYIKVE